MLIEKNEYLKKTICIFTTRWGAHFGGINVFNREMCIGIKEAYSQIKLICIVEDYDDEEKEDADKYEIELIKISKGTYPVQIVEYLHEKSINPAVWVGHDIYTGEIAVDCSKLTISISAVISHFDYEYYGSYKGSIGKVVEEKMLNQQMVLNNADLTFSVGPKLKNTVLRLTKKAPTVLNPGCFHVDEYKASLNDGFFAMSSGRLELNDDNIKRVSLVMNAYSKISKEIYIDKMLTIFGVEESQLEVIAKNNSENILNIKALEFSKDRNHIFSSLSKQTMFIMPSLHEGFGLTGLEAISMEIPLILTSNSGLYDMLLEKNLIKYVYVINMTGDNERDSNEIYNAMKNVFIDRKKYKENAIKLKIELDKVISWKNLGVDFLNALSFIVLDKSFPVKNEEEFKKFFCLSNIINLRELVENLFIKYKKIIDPNNARIEKKYGYILYQIISVYQNYINVQDELDEQKRVSKIPLKKEEEKFKELLEELKEIDISILSTLEAEEFGLEMSELKDFKNESYIYDIENLDFLKDIYTELESFSEYISNIIKNIEEAEANRDSYLSQGTGPLPDELISIEDSLPYRDLLEETNALMEEIEYFDDLNVRSLDSIREELSEIEEERKDNIKNSLFNFSNIITYLKEKFFDDTLSSEEHIYVKYCLTICISFKVFSENIDSSGYEKGIREEFASINIDVNVEKF